MNNFHRSTLLYYSLLYHIYLKIEKLTTLVSFCIFIRLPPIILWNINPIVALKRYKLVKMMKVCLIDLFCWNNPNNPDPAPVQSPAKTEPNVIILCKYKSVNQTEETQLGIKLIKVAIKDCLNVWDNNKVDSEVCPIIVTIQLIIIVMINKKPTTWIDRLNATRKIEFAF